ncbi:hypothetical protein Cyagr_2814 [Cyanobium gracile PCC 6307]|uniref:Uncharacterized protein n=1 Tax=Cyanobium gracile (strain ATCC 27147 / PCC 6307) TaxID=292564 RepID=K9PB10_CYAGP|nr:hypothetical protein Cyagr_2814 [Cyanobium gracile PCC 6307]
MVPVIRIAVGPSGSRGAPNDVFRNSNREVSLVEGGRHEMMQIRNGELCPNRLMP